MANQHDASLLARHSPLVLASASPRRAEILRSMGIPFEADPSHIGEDLLPGETAHQAAQRLARAKASEVAARHPGRWVLGADTLVVIDRAILGKPRDDDDARRMLRQLAGRVHRVVTGVHLHRDDRTIGQLVEESRVSFAPLSDDEIEWYVASGEPRDKAGAYGVQGVGARFIEAVEGSYSNVMGLPAHVLYRLMRDAGESALALLALSCP